MVLNTVRQSCTSPGLLCQSCPHLCIWSKDGQIQCGQDTVRTSFQTQLLYPDRSSHQGEKGVSFSTPLFHGYEASCSACSMITALTPENKTLKWNYRRRIGFLLLHSFSATLVASSSLHFSLFLMVFFSFFPFLSFSLCLNFLKLI